MTALFGNTSALSSSKNLVEFRAGKMNLRGTTVTADKRKGQVYVYQSDDSLMHFCWKDRVSGTVEDDLIIFPDDIEFKRVDQCTTGRVYILKFKSSSRKFFFWMQEPKDDKDQELCKKVNELLNNPPTPGSNTSGGFGNNPNLASLQPALASLGDQLGDSSLQNLLNNMDQNQLMQLLGISANEGRSFGFEEPQTSSQRVAETTKETSTTVSTATTTTAAMTSSTTTSTATTVAATPTTVSGPVQLEDLQSILSSMEGVTSAPQQEVDLSKILTTEALMPLLADKEIQNRLKPFLPAVEDLPESENELRESIQSPQFKQALQIFSSALQSGQLAPLMQQFKLGQPAIDAAAKGDIIAFMKALQEEEQCNVDEDMALD